MAVLPLLAEPAAYRACETDLVTDAAARSYWLGLFRSHFDVQLEAASALGVDSADLRRARRAMDDELDRIEADPAIHGALDIKVLDEVRTAVLRRSGISDEFAGVKAREDELAMSALPDRLAALDALEERERLESVVRGMLAGNLFDMGAVETADAFASATVPFDLALDLVPARPWFIDELDALVEHWVTARPRRVVVLVDNAGADLVLGLFPLAREMIRAGCTVVLSANAGPCLNDASHGEVVALARRAADVAPELASPDLRLVCSGVTSPVIDLAAIGEELAEAARGADLLVLHGMGRSIESNRTAAFTCAVWRIAMVKDPEIARTIGARMFDAVVRFTEAP